MEIMPQKSNGNISKRIKLTKITKKGLDPCDSGGKKTKPS